MLNMIYITVGTEGEELARVELSDKYIATFPPGIGTGILEIVSKVTNDGSTTVPLRMTPPINKGREDTLEITWKTIKL